jgi:hypothetical protein
MNAASTIIEELPRWAVMWLLASGLFFGGKLLMVRGAGLRGWRWAGFTLGWVGMDTEPFRGDARAPARKDARFPWNAVVNTLLGTGLLWGAARWFEHPLAAGWVGMVGLIFVLHFGAFGVLAGVWRTLGIPVTPIMRNPVAATTLSEFWGKRWNLAFRDLAHHTVFTPVARRWGHRTALWASFGASALMHDLIISVPAGAGYGLPTGYFLLQALGLALEKKMDRRPHSTAVKWLRTHAFTALPAFFLFHPPFVERVMVPFFHAIGALP